MDWVTSDEFAASMEADALNNDWQDKLLVDLCAGVELKPTNWSFIWGLRKICRSNENIHRVFNGIGSETPSIATPGFKSKKPKVFKQTIKDAYAMSSCWPSSDLGGRDTDRFSPEIYLAFIYLIAVYHIRFDTDIKRIKQDIANFQYCFMEFERRLIPHVMPNRSDHWPESRYNGVLDRLGFEMVKIEISARTFDVLGGILKQPWSDPKYRGTYPELFERSQYAAFELWGSTLYPVEEIQDDLETSSAQQLQAWSHYKRYEVSVLRGDLKTGLDCQLEIDRLTIAFLEYMTKHMLLINLAAREMSETTSARLMASARYSVVHFYAAALEFHRVAHWTEDPLGDTMARTALEGILQIALKIYETDGDVALMRVAWPLMLAGIETRESLQQDWVLERFNSLSTLGTNFARASECVKHIVARQKGGEPRQDFLALIKHEELEPFVLH